MKFYFMALSVEFRDKRTYRKAENPPNKAPDASPTQKPIMKPVFTLSQHDGPCPYEYPLGGGAGMRQELNLYKVSTTLNQFTFISKT